MTSMASANAISWSSAPSSAPSSTGATVVTTDPPRSGVGLFVTTPSAWIVLGRWRRTASASSSTVSYSFQKTPSLCISSLNSTIACIRSSADRSYRTGTRLKNSIKSTSAPSFFRVTKERTSSTVPDGDRGVGDPRLSPIRTKPTSAWSMICRLTTSCASVPMLGRTSVSHASTSTRRSSRASDLLVSFIAARTASRSSSKPVGEHKASAYTDVDLGIQFPL